MFMECSHSTGVKIKVVYSKRRAFPDCFAAYKYLPGLGKKISSVDFSFIHRAYFLCQANIRNPLRYLLDSVKSDR